MIDIDGFISNDSQQTSINIRENIQNKNLLSSKGDLYIGTATEVGVLHLGSEGQLLGGSSASSQYDYAYYISNPNLSEVDFKARKCVNYTNYESESYQIFTYDSSANFYPFNFTDKGENNIVAYNFNLILDSTSNYIYSFAPIVFMKKKAFNSVREFNKPNFNNYFQINFIQGLNDESYLYRSEEVYYYYDDTHKVMTPISISSSEADSGLNAALEMYGFLYTKRKYSIFNFDCSEVSTNINCMLRIDLDETGIYGVYQYNRYEKAWEKISWESIYCVRIK